MGTADGAPGGAAPGNAGSGSGSFGSAASGGFRSAAEALRAGDAVADYLNSPAAAELDGASCGEALIAVGRIQSRLAAAQAALLARFDAADAHDSDGYATSAVQAVLEALGKKRGPEDDRTQPQRFHDALQECCEPPTASCRYATVLSGAGTRYSKVRETGIDWCGKQVRLAV
jgi:hypothetical protein